MNSILKNKKEREREDQKWTTGWSKGKKAESINDIYAVFCLRCTILQQEIVYKLYTNMRNHAGSEYGHGEAYDDVDDKKNTRQAYYCIAGRCRIGMRFMPKLDSG